MYQYGAWLIRVVDGDTMHIGIDLGLDVAINETIRLYGLNAPESSTAPGKIATSYVNVWFQQHCPDSRFVLDTIKDRREKFGRYLGTITAPDGHVLNTDLIDTHNAVPYFPK